MRILLDTHAFLWAAADAPQLSPKARALFTAADNELLLSVASVWEMAIKASLGKLRLELPLDRLVRGGLAQPGLRLQHIELDHALRVRRLPWHHRDPFDRLLVAQALAEGVPLLSRDAAFDAYGVERIWS